MSKTNMRPVVVYVTENTLKKIDALVTTRKMLEADPAASRSISRASVVREQVELLADRGAQALEKFSGDITTACKGVRG